MTIDEKRAVLNQHCMETPCGECPLAGCGDWSVPFGVVKPCLTIDRSPESDLDKVLTIIRNGRCSTPKTKNYDIVTKPEHYNQGGIECIEAIKASMSEEEYLGFLKGQVIKYLWRYRHKGKPEQDLKKAEYYNTKLIEEVRGTCNEE